MVDRIDVDLGGDTYDSPTGTFVYYTDYEALEAKLAALMEIYKSGSIEAMPKYSQYKYRVIGRNDTPVHHTESLKDAQDYLNKCRDIWASSAAKETK